MKTVRHIGIVVNDLKKSMHFYGDLLGLKVKIQAVESGDYIDQLNEGTAILVTTVKMSADNGPTLVELLKFDMPKVKSEKTPGPFEIGPTHVAFTVDNLDEIYERLSAANVLFNCKPLVAPGGKAKVTFCHDPDGTLIELVEELE